MEWRSPQHDTSIQGVATLSKTSLACLQAPHDQPKVAQAMIERWVEGVLKQGR